MHEIATESIQGSNTGTKDDARVALGLSIECYLGILEALYLS